MINVQENIPLAPLTTFKIGGAARFFVEAETVADVMEAVSFAQTKGLKLFILAGGSNVLFADAGFDGLVVHLVSRYIEITPDGLVHVSAGMLLGEVINMAMEGGMTGIERMSGVPGSLGGAVRGNAGAFGQEIGNVVVGVRAVNQKTGLVQEFTHEACRFVYRQSLFKCHSEWVILEVTLGLTPGGNRDELFQIAKETRAKREEKHAQSAKCAGSFFMNPIVKDEKLLREFAEETGAPSRNNRLPAGWLITKAGVRGKKIGGAQMSNQHPNYLVNTGKATADHVVMLASFVKTRVRNQLGVQLKEEIQFVGF